MQLVVGNGDAEAAAEFGQFFFVKLLLLVSDVAALAGFAQAIALDRFGQDHGGRARVVDGGLVRGVDLFRIVSAARQFPQLIVRQVLDQLGQQCGYLPKKCSRMYCAGSTLYFKKSPSTTSLHALDQQTVLVLAEQGIPIAAPDDLDDSSSRRRGRRLPAPE